MGRTVEEIENEIDVVEHKKFMNAMNDHWSAEDYEFDRESARKLEGLRKELEDARDCNQ